MKIVYPIVPASNILPILLGGTYIVYMETTRHYPKSSSFISTKKNGDLLMFPAAVLRSGCCSRAKLGGEQASG